MPNVIARGFVSVARFSGRDTRAQFWPYAAAAFGLYFGVGWVALIFIALPVFGASPPAGAAFQVIATRFLLVSLLTFGLLVLLLASAVARRLHDSGRSAIWGLMPLPFVAYSFTVFFRVSQFGLGTSPEMQLFLSVFASNMLYLLSLGALVVFLASRSTPAPNRYG